MIQLRKQSESFVFDITDSSSIIFDGKLISDNYTIISPYSKEYSVEHNDSLLKECINKKEKFAFGEKRNFNFDLKFRLSQLLKNSNYTGITLSPFIYINEKGIEYLPGVCSGKVVMFDRNMCILSSKYPDKKIYQLEDRFLVVCKDFEGNLELVFTNYISEKDYLFSKFEEFIRSL